MASIVDRIFGVKCVANTGSTARDFCMLERNILSHVKLALLLSVLSASLLLQTRLVPSEGEDIGASHYGVPLASLQFAGALLSIAAGIWEYLSGCKDLLRMSAFLRSPKPHLAIMTVVIAVVFVTCIILLDLE
ncbi:hypothetical protein CPB85DRAFT_1290534 [Mucidula mucida]|nr:hypothetical protein CPB85DRAFT_1290534 [Mucidula mucida]